MAFPFKPRDWVSDDGDRVAQVRSIYESLGEVVFDLVIYDRNGEKLGRVSPREGGPSSFEPACSIDGWQRIEVPRFPLELRLIPDGAGRSIARFWAGKRLPPANWTPPKRGPRLRVAIQYDRYRRALRLIADGHNDARQLAADVLNGKVPA